MQDNPYHSIVSFCESCLAKYGDTFLGVGWTKKQEDADTRYQIMLEVIQSDNTERLELLDFGCGASHLYEYILRQNINNVVYSGLDISEKFLTLSKQKFPSINYYHLNILVNNDELPDFDYIIMNGVFTLKCTLSFDEMFSYLQLVLLRLFKKARVGIAFNVMSKHLDWERDDLFHLPFDELASFLTNNLRRHFVIRHDYHLYEYAVYVYK